MYNHVGLIIASVGACGLRHQMKGSIESITVFSASHPTQRNVTQKKQKGSKKTATFVNDKTFQHKNVDGGSMYSE